MRFAGCRQKDSSRRIPTYTCKLTPARIRGASAHTRTHASAHYQTFNNPTLVPRPDGSVTLFYHNTGGWGTAVSGAVATASTAPTYAEHVMPVTWQRVMPGPSFRNQLFVHPCEDPFAWWDAAAGRYRMLLHTFRMGMICGAGTATPCAPGTELLGGEPYGALASSAGPDPWQGWSYVEDQLAYNWTVPSSVGSQYTLRRRERPFLLFDDDGKVYLFTSASPANQSQQMFAHVQQVRLPPGVGGPLSTVHQHKTVRTRPRS